MVRWEVVAGNRWSSSLEINKNYIDEKHREVVSEDNQNRKRMFEKKSELWHLW